MFKFKSNSCIQSKIKSKAPPLQSSVDHEVIQTRNKLGMYGENLAQSYLEENGYIVEAKNWRGEIGEIDLVVRKISTLVIVEVRTTSTSWLARPAEATPLSKQKQVARCTNEYLSQRNQQDASDIDYIRFDIIGVLLPKSLLQQKSNGMLKHINGLGVVIDHVENAYTSSWAF